MWRALTEGYPDWFLLAGVPYIIFMSLYLVLGGGFLLLDWWPWLHKQVRHAKCQPETSPSTRDVATILSVTLPQIMLLYPLAFVCGLPFLKGRFSLAEEDLPSWREVAWSTPVFALASEIFFYYNHRLLHSSWLYARVHKLHHEFKVRLFPRKLRC